MQTPKIKEPNLPYTSRAASYASDSGGANPASMLSQAGAISRPQLGSQTSNTGRPSLLGGVK